MLQHAIVPLDGSKLAEYALPYAKTILANGGHLTLLAVVDMPTYPYLVSTGGAYPLPVENTELYDKTLKEMSAHAQDYLKRHAESLQEAGIEVSLRVVQGRAADAILSAVEELKADVIVMSTHGRSGLSRLVHGSVTQAVLAHAHCPVLVVPVPKTVS